MSGIILRGSNLRINARLAISHFVQSADGIKVAALRAFNLETRNASVTAKGSNPNREPLRFVDDKESLPACFVSYWSDCHGVFCGLIFSRDFPRLAKYIAKRVPTSHKAFARCNFKHLRNEITQHLPCQLQTIGNQSKDGRKTFPRGQIFPTKNRQILPLSVQILPCLLQVALLHSLAEMRSIYHAKCFPVFSDTFPRAILAGIPPCRLRHGPRYCKRIAFSNRWVFSRVFGHFRHSY